MLASEITFVKIYKLHLNKPRVHINALFINRECL